MYIAFTLAIFYLIISSVSLSAGTSCNWADGERNNTAALLISGQCTIGQVTQSKHIEQQDTQTLLITAPIFVLPDSRLTLDGLAIKNIRLLSQKNFYASIISEGSELFIINTHISSFDPRTGSPDMNLEDGRAFIRVDAFIDKDGKRKNGFIDVNGSEISYLGYNSIGRDGDFSAYGLSLKVRKEEELDFVQVNGRIRNSSLNNNYRGYYSYGARNIIFEGNLVHSNHDYGVDPHDDSDGFLAINNIIRNNGGTGLALSRRCDNSAVVGNKIFENGNNGILVHDLSNSVVIENNSVERNGLDGIVIHDSNQIRIIKNNISKNRNGIRIFAGSTLIDVEENKFNENRRTDIFLLNGNLEAANNLSDYSLGTDWNAENISRHNDSRVRMAFVKNNHFASKAKIEAIETEMVHFLNNRYAGDVLFNFKNSDRISLDGSMAVGGVSYQFRSNTETAAQYTVDAKLNSELSILEGDQVIVLNEIPLFPALNQNFILEFFGTGTKVIKTVGANSDIQTGSLKEIPLTVLKGEMRLSSYLGDFMRNGDARFEISSNDWSEVALEIKSQSCSISKLEIDKRFLPSRSDNIFYVSTSTEFQFSNILAANRGRAIMDLTCLQR